MGILKSPLGLIVLAATLLSSVWYIDKEQKARYAVEREQINAFRQFVLDDFSTAMLICGYRYSDYDRCYHGKNQRKSELTRLKLDTTAGWYSAVDENVVTLVYPVSTALVAGKIVSSFQQGGLGRIVYIDALGSAVHVKMEMPVLSTEVTKEEQDKVSIYYGQRVQQYRAHHFDLNHVSPSVDEIDEVLEEKRLERIKARAAQIEQDKQRREKAL